MALDCGRVATKPPAHLSLTASSEGGAGLIQGERDGGRREGWRWEGGRFMQHQPPFSSSPQSCAVHIYPPSFPQLLLTQYLPSSYFPWSFCILKHLISSMKRTRKLVMLVHKKILDCFSVPNTRGLLPWAIWNNL